VEDVRRLAGRPCAFQNSIARRPRPLFLVALAWCPLSLRLHDDTCGAVRERARATNPLHRAGIDPFRYLAHAGPHRSRQGLPDAFFQLGSEAAQSAIAVILDGMNVIDQRLVRLRG